MPLMAFYAALIFSFTVLANASKTACNEDNVLRGLQNPTNSAIASVFCSTYIQSTITVSTAVTTTPVSTTSTTFPDALTTLSLTDVETSTNTVYTTFSTVYTVDVTDLLTYQSTPLAFSTPPNGIYARATLDANGLSLKLATVPASRISSACSCLVTPSPALTVTLTSTDTVTTTTTAIIGPLATDTITTITTTSIPVDDLETLTAVASTTTTIDLTVTTLAPAPTETVICGLPGGENAAAVSHLIFQGNGIGFNDCLQRCKDTPACRSIFWFGDISDGVITCRMVTLPVSESLNYDFVGLPQAFYFSDKDCPFQVGPIGY